MPINKKKSISENWYDSINKDSWLTKESKRLADLINRNPYDKYLKDAYKELTGKRFYKKEVKND